MLDAEAAIVYRGWVAESHHRARIAVTAPDGALRLSLGDPDLPTLPRSALKPFQTIAMLEHGLDLDGELLALAAASHFGETFHIDGVRRILDGAGLSEADLVNTPDFPLGEQARVDWIRAGHDKEPLAHNCSGKHAAMLRTCVRAGWERDGYRDPSHPLQQAVRGVIDDYCGVEGEPVTDGCSAPAFVATLPGLARGFGRWAAAEEGAAKRVADAYRAHPEYTAGTTDPVVELHRAVPGLVAKAGAEGIFGVGLADGTGLAIKISDGASRPRHDLALAVLRGLGHDAPRTDPLVVISPALEEALARL